MFADVLLHGGSSARDMAPVQCLGPGCVYAARPHSKYCSEECGIQLAIRCVNCVYIHAHRESNGDMLLIVYTLGESRHCYQRHRNGGIMTTTATVR